MRVLKIIFFTLCVLTGLFNLTQLYGQALDHAQNHDGTPFHSLGDQFAGLKRMFKDIRAVGYYTDKDLNNALAIAQFEQAQYMLAPTVLDLNNTNYRWVIFDCTNARFALEAIKKLGLTPMKINNGIILAFNPQAKP